MRLSSNLALLGSLATTAKSASATYAIPNRGFPAYAYRDFSVGCGWDGALCTAASWEITEPMDAYQGPFVLLASFMMSGG